MQDVVMSLLVVVLGAWQAGVIYPPSIGLPSVSRWKIFFIGLACSFVLAGIGGSISPPETPSPAGGVLGSFAIMISMGWFIASLIGLIRSWTRRRSSAPLEQAISAVQQTEPIAKPKPLTLWQQFKAEVAKAKATSERRAQERLIAEAARAKVQTVGRKNHAEPVKKSGRPTRAIRNGWSIGEVEFAYEDGEGEVTYRHVTVHSVTATYLKGECHEKQAERTFRMDRILGDVTDRETGEILSPKAYARRMKNAI